MTVTETRSLRSMATTPLPWTALSRRSCTRAISTSPEGSSEWNRDGPLALCQSSDICSLVQAISLRPKRPCPIDAGYDDGKDERSHGHSRWARGRDAIRASKQAIDPQITLTPEA